MMSISKQLTVALFAFLLIIAGGIVTAHSSFAATENVTVNLTVGTTSTTTDDQDDDDDEVETSDTSRSGQSAELLIDIARFEVSQETVEIVWETTVQSKSSVRWQRADGSGESFVQASENYGRTHTTRITGLQSGTRYEIELTAEGQNGDTKTRREIVQTELPDGPQSVTDLRSNLTGEGGVQLVWSNPDGAYDYVRVTRRSEFFSDEPLSGELVYEGVSQRVVDTDIEPGETYFYSVFTRSEDGQWSAPALTAIYVPLQGETPQTDPDRIDEIISDQPEAPKETQKLLSNLNFTDLIFSQGQLLAGNRNDQVYLTADRPFSVGLDYEKLPEVLKTVVVTITHPDGEDKSFSFLLRADEKKDFYKATVAELGEPGAYPVDVTVLDYKYRRVKTLSGEIVITARSDQQATTTQTIISKLQDFRSRGSDTTSFALVLILLLGLGALIIGYEHRSREHGRAHG